MIRPVAVLLCALTLGCAAAHNYADPEGPRYSGEGGVPPPGWALNRSIRVVTFNIEYAMEVDRAVAALAASPPLRHPDILCLQEMDAPGADSVARRLRMNHVYYPASIHPKTKRDFGNAVLSPWPIEESWKVILPHKSRIVKQGRAAVAARVRVAGRPITVYSVHLGSPIGISGGSRRGQAKAIVEDARTRPDPVIVAGDFNSKGVGEVFVEAGFSWITERVGPTTKGFSFDHVFVRGLAPAPLPACGVERGFDDVSDHRPVWTVVVPPGQPAPPGAPAPPAPY